MLEQHGNLYGWLTDNVELRKEDTLYWHSAQTETDMVREDISEYVAQLQLHMALQARNLVPALTQTNDSREKFLQETQATLEKMISRQRLR